MNKKILNILTFVTAILLSSISGYFSVFGMTAIFSGSYYSILTLGSVLEFSKLVTASWLYNNWNVCGRFLKTYLTISLTILVFITSLGCFGYLSKSYIESNSNRTLITSEIKNLDQENQFKQKEIDNIKLSIDSLDKLIQEYYNRGRLKAGSNELINQENRRNDLSNKIKSIQNEILSNNKKKIEIENSLEIEDLKVGPLKYVTGLFLEETKDNIEKSIKFLILLIILVFDPLAILLLIAANTSLSNKTIECNDMSFNVSSTSDGKTFEDQTLVVKI